MRLRPLLVVVALLGVACSGGSSVVAPPSTVPPTTAPSPSPSPSPPPSPSPSPSPTQSCAEQTFASMTEAQRIGQLFIFGLRDNALGSAEIAGVQQHHLGSVSYIQTTHVGVSGVRAVANAVQALATKANTAGIGFWVAANQEGGEIQALQGPGFSTMPTAVTQGTYDPATLKADAKTWGRQMISAGVNLNFAPVYDVVPAGTESENQPIGVLKREYGSTPTAVAEHADAFMEGMRSAGVTTTAKHFPGLGRVLGNTDFTANVVDSVTTPNDPDLASFASGIKDDVPMVMVALALYTKIDKDHLAVFSPTVMGLLRSTYGFDGVIVSDDIGAAVAIQDIPAGTRAIDFLQAGGDLIVSKYVQPADEMASALVSKAASDASFKALVDAAVMRVLAAKDAAGLLPCSA